MTIQRPDSRAAARFITRHRMKFNHPAEVLVYEALLCLQAELSPFRTIGIAANCCVRVVERTFVPDFLVTYAGRQLGVEVDGATHNRKLASDHSRQQLLTDAGIDILRIDIADVFDPDELAAFVLRVKARLQA